MSLQVRTHVDRVMVKCRCSTRGRTMQVNGTMIGPITRYLFVHSSASFSGRRYALCSISGASGLVPLVAQVEHLMLFVNWAVAPLVQVTVHH